VAGARINAAAITPSGTTPPTVANAAMRFATVRAAATPSHRCRRRSQTGVDKPTSIWCEEGGSCGLELWLGVKQK